MNRQSPWLFEAPFTTPAWKVQQAHPYALGENGSGQFFRSIVSESTPSEEVTREIISGFSRYQRTMNSIPSTERSKIDQLAHQILKSYNPGGSPIKVVRLVGHADKDIPRRPDFEKKISGDRALVVQNALISAINNSSISSQIRWQQLAEGANQPLVRNPLNEVDRKRNRRVELFLIGESYQHQTSTKQRLYTNLDRGRKLREIDSWKGNSLREFETHMSIDDAIKTVETKVPEAVRNGMQAWGLSCYDAVGEMVKLLRQRGAFLGKRGKKHCPSHNISSLCEAVSCVKTANKRCQDCRVRYKSTLKSTVEQLKQLLNDGFLIEVGVYSGLGPGFGKAVNCSLISPDHYVLIVGFDEPNQFVFWNSWGGESVGIPNHPGFGFLFYDATANRFSTARIEADMEVSDDGFHVSNPRQKRYQVVSLQPRPHDQCP
jgi:outer membrane protein OmpA-like peptidoglycan-associated protein